MEIDRIIKLVDEKLKGVVNHRAIKCYDATHPQNSFWASKTESFSDAFELTWNKNFYEMTFALQESDLKRLKKGLLLLKANGETNKELTTKEAANLY